MRLYSSSWDISGVYKGSLNNLRTHGCSVCGTESGAFPSHEPKWQIGVQSVMKTAKESWICCYMLLLSVGKLSERHMTSVRLHMVLAAALHMALAQHSSWHPMFLLKSLQIHCPSLLTFNTYLLLLWLLSFIPFLSLWFIHRLLPFLTLSQFQHFQ